MTPRERAGAVLAELPDHTTGTTRVMFVARALAAQGRETLEALDQELRLVLESLTENPERDAAAGVRMAREILEGHRKALLL